VASRAFEVAQCAVVRHLLIITGLAGVRTSWLTASVDAMSDKAKDERDRESGEEDSQPPFTRIESPDLPTESITVDMSRDKLVEFVQKGIKEGGTWVTAAPDDPEARTLINIGALSWMTLIPVAADAAPDDVRHLDPEA
jgi:hypothetical protein